MKYGEVYSAEMTAEMQLNRVKYNRKSRIENHFNPAFWCGRRAADLQANRASLTPVLRQDPSKTSELKTVHRTVFLTLLTLLGFKPRLPF
jgi:hypothetical protein